MSNLDKDIKILKEMIDFKKQFTLLKHEQEQIQATENVLKELSNLKWKNEIYVKSIKSHKETIEKQDKELETYKDKCIELATDIDALKTDLIDHEKTSFEFQEENIKLRKELETYKKIAEKLAEEYIALESRLDETVEIDDDYCNFDAVQCFSFRKKSCKECIIDWARKEVEKDE